ncbi:glycosyltransferase family 39 protein [Aquisphaera insulae]|uniref:glycosyltransferase family 39 protein n=1 Tax=Aquisphaera insulae TaxID=2712864 RepID=UPI0013ED589D|nr:glycosyltransferase family 39 protein [Aquisphaera insulae]
MGIDTSFSPSPERESAARPGLMLSQHVVRVILLMAATAAMLVWGLRHTEACYGDGLRAIEQARQVARGDWRGGLIGAVDHPLHPLLILAAHPLVGGDDAASWQRAAVALGFACVVLLVIPAYLLGRDAFGDQTAWLAAMLVAANPLLVTIVANALTESSFLLAWTWGLWAAVRFLREGRFVWLPVTIGLGALAYLARPEGILLPVSVAGTLLLLPLHQATRIHWPRWAAATAFLVVGSLAAAGPFIALEGGIGTRPSVARVLGLAPGASADAPERERPLAAGQSASETYRQATARVLRCVRVAAFTPLLLLALPGYLLARRSPARARLGLFFGLILGISVAGLVRLHATGGYCTARHALIPALILVVFAAHAIERLMGMIAIPGSWLGPERSRVRPGAAIWVLAIAVLVILPRRGQVAPAEIPGPFHVYRDSGDWLARTVEPGEAVLDMTDWSSFFSNGPGYRFADVQAAPADPSLRWVVLRRSHLFGHWGYSGVLRGLVAGLKPTAVVPEHPAPGQIQVEIYDRFPPAGRIAASGGPGSPEVAPRR